MIVKGNTMDVWVVPSQADLVHHPETVGGQRLDVEMFDHYPQVGVRTTTGGLEVSSRSDAYLCVIKQLLLCEAPDHWVVLSFSHSKNHQGDVNLIEGPYVWLRVYHKARCVLRLSHHKNTQRAQPCRSFLDLLEIRNMGVDLYFQLLCRSLSQLEVA